LKKHLKIIVFEDDPTLTKLLTVTLQQKGHIVEVYNNPTMCPVFQDHENNCPMGKPCADVIITDQMMPKMTGIDFLILQRKRGCQALDANKAIITGAAINDDTLQEIEGLGCKLFRKPFRISELCDWVEECAERLSQTVNE